MCSITNCNFLAWSVLRLVISFLRKDDDVRDVTKLSFFVMILSLTEVWLEIFSVKYCTNILLKKIGAAPVDTDICSFCGLSREELEHLLFDCPFSKTFRNEFKMYWYFNTKEATTYL